MLVWDLAKLSVQKQTCAFGKFVDLQPVPTEEVGEVNSLILNPSSDTQQHQE